MTALKRLFMLALLAAVALAIGFATGFAVIDVSNWIAPYRPRHDDTLREFIPAGLALLATAVTAALIFVLGLRALIARWRAAGDIGVP